MSEHTTIELDEHDTATGAVSLANDYPFAAGPAEIIGGYAVPSDPMDDLHCEGCQ